jgi:hypothetical protein
MRLIHALERTTDPALISLHVGIDDDDPRRMEYEQNWHDSVVNYPYNLYVRSDLRQVVAWCNHLAAITVDTYWALGHVNDDNLPETPGWDERVLASLERQQTGFCFADDCHPGRPPGSLACHIFLTSNIVTALGYMAYPELRHLYVDDIWTQWGRASSIEFLGDVRIRHLHPTAVADVDEDDTYRAAAACDLEDRPVYVSYLENGLQFDVAKINALRNVT